MTSPAPHEQIDLPLALHEAAHALTCATALPGRPGADRITVHTGTDARGFYAETNGFWRNNDGSMRKMTLHPVGVCAGPAASMLFDGRVRMTRADILCLGAGAVPLLANEYLGICPDDWEQLQVMNLGPAEANAATRAALLMCIMFETLLRGVAGSIVEQLVTEGLPVAELCPVFLRQHSGDVENLLTMANSALYFSHTDVAAHMAQELGKAATAYGLSLAKPFLEAVQR